MRFPLQAALLGLVGLTSANHNSYNSGIHVPGSIPNNPFEPLQQRLAYAGFNAKDKTAQMTVSWNTYAQLPNPSVQYGLSPSQLTSFASSTISITYPSSRTFNNHVQINGLKPNTKYWYKVQYSNCQNCAYLPLYTFTTARLPGDESPFSIAIVVDMGLMGGDGESNTLGPYGDTNPLSALGPNDTNTIQSLLEQKDTYDFLGHWGDIGYFDYALKESFQGYLGLGSETLSPNRSRNAEIYESFAEQYYDQMTPITAESPYIVAVGNHEANCINTATTNKVAGPFMNMTQKYLSESFCLPGQTNFTGYRNHWKMPSESSKGQENFWYSFDHGMVHMVIISTETDLGTGRISPNGGSPDFGKTPTSQIDWLRNDLATVDRDVTPWVIVGLHRPWYAQAARAATDSQAAFEPLFQQYGVDLYMQGHEHFYQRNTPMYNGTVDPNKLNNPSSPWNIINGAGGHYDGLDVMTMPLKSYVDVAFDTAYGWSRLNIHNRTHMTHEFVASANGSVLDTATLYKAHTKSALNVTKTVASLLPSSTLPSPSKIKKI